MPWGPWIQPANARVGKWIGASDQGRRFGGAVDDDGTPLLDGDDLADAWTTSTKGKLSFEEVDAATVDATSELAARDSAIAGALITLNVDTASSVELADVEPGFAFAGHAVYRDASVIASGLAYVNEPDAFHWVETHPSYTGQPFQYHPDDEPDTGVGDYGTVLDQWVTVAWNVAAAEAVTNYDAAPMASIGRVDPTTTAQPGVDTGYAFRVDAWPDSESVTAETGSPFSVPADVVAGFGFVGPYAVTDKASWLMDRGVDSTLPYLIETSALTDWGWAVDGSTTDAAAFPLFLRIITDFYYRPARFRLWVESTVVPPLRQFPRDDSLAVGTPRLWPPAQSQQHAPARIDGYI